MDWTQVRFKPSLPKADACPVSAVHQDPEFYQEGARKKCEATYYKDKPFGTLPGYHTTQGVVTIPTEPVGGYVYHEGEWRIYASPSWRGARTRRRAGARRR